MTSGLATSLAYMWQPGIAFSSLTWAKQPWPQKFQRPFVASRAWFWGPSVRISVLLLLLFSHDWPPLSKGRISCSSLSDTWLLGPPRFSFVTCDHLSTSDIASFRVGCVGDLIRGERCSSDSSVMIEPRVNVERSSTNTPPWWLVARMQGETKIELRPFRQEHCPSLHVES